MQPRDLTSLAQQLMFSWNSNKKAQYPINMIMTGLKPDGFLSKKIKLVGLDTGVY